MTDYFAWDASKYGLQVPAMDKEHEQLIALMNKLHALHEAHVPKADLAKALQDLANFTVWHFTDEERYMEKIGYPELATHKETHKQLLARVFSFAEEFKRTGKLTDDLFLFLKVWLKSHICGIDIRYARHGSGT